MPHKWAALVISVAASGCVLLAGCGGGSGGSDTSGGSAAGPMKRLSNDASTSGTGVKLTGDFCTDFKNMGQSVRVPAGVQSDLNTLRQHGVKYLNQAATYFSGLAA